MGTALGTLVVTTLLDLSWPVRLGLLALVVVLGLAYVVYRHRAAIVAGASASAHTGAADPAPAASSSGPTSELTSDPPTEPRA